MLAIKCRQLVFISDKIFVRNFRNFRNRLERVNETIKSCQVNGEIVKNEDIPNYIKQNEGDSPKVVTMFLEYFCNESLIGKYKNPYQIENQQYFNENMPNLLTWSEKEKIRDLVNKNKWTTKHIVENYPVTEDAVEKLIAFDNWKPASKSRIERHDANAKRNWRELKEGTLNICEELRQHFLKFVDRNVPPLEKSSIKFNQTQQLEYIIRKCAKNEPNLLPETNNKIFENNKIDNVVKVKEVTDLPYPERIRIPKGTYKKGATYKVNDCFYDDDGRFIYRVISLH